MFKGQVYVYWSGLEYSPDNDFAWRFRIDWGLQDFGDGSDKNAFFYALAVRPGDVAGTVPAPGTLGLLGLAVLGLAMRRCDRLVRLIESGGQSEQTEIGPAGSADRYPTVSFRLGLL